MDEKRYRVTLTAVRNANPPTGGARRDRDAHGAVHPRGRDGRLHGGADLPVHGGGDGGGQRPGGRRPVRGPYIADLHCGRLGLAPGGDGDRRSRRRRGTDPPATIAHGVGGGDYTARSGKLTFYWDETMKTVSVPVTNDLMDEEDEETFTL